MRVLRHLVLALSLCVLFTGSAFATDLIPTQKEIATAEAPEAPSEEVPVPETQKPEGSLDRIGEMPIPAADFMQPAPRFMTCVPGQPCPPCVSGQACNYHTDCGFNGGCLWATKTCMCLIPF